MMLSPTKIERLSRRPELWLYELSKANLKAFSPAIRWGTDGPTLQRLLNAGMSAAHSLETISEFPAVEPDVSKPRLPSTAIENGYFRTRAHILHCEEVVALSFIARLVDAPRLVADQQQLRATKWREELTSCRKLRSARRVRAKELAEYRQTELAKRQPYLRLDPNGYWYLCWSVERRSYRISSRSKDRRQAEAALRQWIATRTLPKVPREQGNQSKLVKRSDGVWWIAWTENRRRKLRSTKTRDKREARRVFETWCSARAACYPKIPALTSAAPSTNPEKPPAS